MNKFYEVLDDLYSPGRWHLDDPMSDEGCDRADFTSGTPAIVRSTPNVEIRKPGFALDFTYSVLDVPIVSHRLAEELGRIAGSSIQRIPVWLGARSGYEILNATRLVRCLDESRSEFMKWTEADERPDRTGRYRMVTKLYIDPKLVPKDTHIFRVWGWTVALIISEEAFNAMSSMKVTGVKFQRVD